MTQTLDKKYERILYSDDEIADIKKEFSLKNIFLLNAVMGIPLLLLFAFVCLFPFLPHSTRGYGAENPSSFYDYLKIVGRDLKICFGFVLFLILLTSLIDFIRTRIDILLKFKKVGIFKVTKIIDRDQVKLIRLSGGHKLKIKSSEQNFDRIKEDDIVEISLTATKRLISFKILK